MTAANPTVLTTDKLVAGPPRTCLVCGHAVGEWHATAACYSLNSRLQPHRPTRATASDYRRRMVDDEVTLTPSGWSVRFGETRTHLADRHPHLAELLAGVIFGLMIGMLL